MPSLLRLPAMRFLLYAAFTVAFDQNMTSPNLSDMAAAFHLSDSERDARLGGLCMFCYFIIGGICSVLIGGMPTSGSAQRKAFRYLLLVYTLANAHIALVLSNTRPGFFSFLLARLAAGAAFGGALPLIFALAAQETGEEVRTLVSGLIGTAVSAGAAIGQVLNGLLPGWRLGYLVSAVLGLAVVLLTDVFLSAGTPPAISNEERRTLWRDQQQSKSQAESKFDFGQYRHILRLKTNRILFLQCVPGNVGWSVVAVFLADFIHGELNFTKPAATLAITVFGLGGLAANMWGSKYGQSLFNQNRKMQLVYLLALPAIAGTVPMIILILGKPTSFFSLVGLLLAAAVGAVPGPNIKGLLLAANSQERRAAVFSAFQLVEMIGKGIGPILVSFLAMATSSRPFAMVLCVLGWAVSGLLSLQLNTCIDKDTSDQHELVSSAFFEIYGIHDVRHPTNNKAHKIV